MRRTCRTSLVVITFITAWLPVGGRALSAAPFSDKQLEAAVRDVLHEPKAELNDDKLKNLYVLEADAKQIRDLSGLEKCKNLALLKLAHNEIADLKPLKDLANLQSLDLA